MSIQDRVTQYRARMRARGLRPVQIWVPDVRQPSFADEAARQAGAVAHADSGSDDMAFVEAISAGWQE